MRCFCGWVWVHKGAMHYCSSMRPYSNPGLESGCAIRLTLFPVLLTRRKRMPTGKKPFRKTSPKTNKTSTVASKISHPLSSFLAKAIRYGVSTATSTHIIETPASHRSLSGWSGRTIIRLFNSSGVSSVYLFWSVFWVGSSGSYGCPSCFGDGIWYTLRCFSDWSNWRDYCSFMYTMLIYTINTTPVCADSRRHIFVVFRLCVFHT